MFRQYTYLPTRSGARRLIWRHLANRNTPPREDAVSSQKSGLMCPIDPEHGVLLEIFSKDPQKKPLYCPHSGHLKTGEHTENFFSYPEAESGIARIIAKSAKKAHIIRKKGQHV